LAQFNTTLFDLLFASNDAGSYAGAPNHIPLGDKIDQYLATGLVVSQSFIDFVQWWMALKDQLPAHYPIS
jgi:hypothetical protein